MLNNIINKIKVNHKIDYSKFLPGYNCGACGYGSCAGLAKAMEEDPENYIKCKPLKKEEKELIKNILKEQ